ATLLLQIHGLLPQRVRLLQQAILRRLVLLHVGLDPQEDVLVDERIDIVGIERKRLVVGGNPLEHVVVFDVRRQPKIFGRLLPVVRRDELIALWVVRREVGRLLQRLDRLVEVALAVVESGELRVHGRFAGLDFLGLQERLLGILVAPGVLVQLGELEIVRRVARVGADELLNDRLGLARVVELLRSVRREEILERELPHLRVVVALRRDLIVLNRFLNVLVVLRVAGLAGLVLLVVAVAEEEIHLHEIRIRLQRLLVAVGGVLVVVLLEEIVGILERFN